MTDRNGTDLEIELENLAGDLVSARKYQPFLEGLFAAPKADWQALIDLCDWPEVKELLERLGETVRVAWLDCPDGSKDYSLVLFFRDSCFWSKTVIVNRALVVAKKKSVAKARR